MNISFNTDARINSIQNNIRANDQKRTITKQNQAADTTKASADFDKVTISKRDSVKDDGSFAAALSRKTAEAVEKGVSAEKTAEIRDKVQTGSYHVDATQVASRMLGYM